MHLMQTILSCGKEGLKSGGRDRKGQRGSVLLYFAVCILLISAIAATISTFTLPLAGVTQDVRLLSMKQSALSMMANTILARCGKVKSGGTTADGMLYVTESNLKSSACIYNISLTVSGANYRMQEISFSHMKTGKSYTLTQSTGTGSLTASSSVSFEYVKTARAKFVLVLPDNETDSDGKRTRAYQVVGLVRVSP